MKVATVNLFFFSLQWAGLFWTHRLRWRRLIATISFFFILLFSASTFLRVAQAQSTPPLGPAPSLNNYPEITVRSRCLIIDQNQMSTTFMLAEDGITQGTFTQTYEMVDPRTETAIFIDLFDQKQGLVGPIGDGLKQLYDLYVSNTFTITTDELAVVIPGAADIEVDPVVTWTGNAGVVVNAVRFISPTRSFAALNRTALVNLLRKTLDYFRPFDIATRQTLVVFSDGTDVVSGVLLGELIAEARARRIQIDTIFIPTGYSDKDNLKRMALETGGQFYDLAELKDTSAWQSVWNRLIAPYPVCQITYRTSKLHPSQLILGEIISGVIQFTRTYTLATNAIPPPRLTILTPTAGAQIALSPTTAAGATFSPTLNLALGWDFAPYPVRKIQQISYQIKGPIVLPRVTVESPPLVGPSLTIPIPLDGLPPGPYFVQVQVQDEVGAVSQEDVAFALVAPPPPVTVVVPPPPPVPTTETTAAPPSVQAPTLTRWQQFVQWIRFDFPHRVLSALVLPALAALLIGLLIWLVRLWRRNQQGNVSSPSSSGIPGVKKINAILYQLRPSPARPLQQILKLSGDAQGATRLPDSIYALPSGAKPTEGANRDALTGVSAEIQWQHREYLLKSQAKKPVKYKRGNDEPKDVVGEVRLQHNDTIILGQTHYAFYTLDNSSAPSSAPNTTAQGQPISEESMNGGTTT